MFLTRLIFAAATTLALQPVESSETWVEAMKNVHAAFHGVPGAFAQFGDSITVSMAFWAPLESGGKNLGPRMSAALALVKGYVKKECWRDWKGPAFGSNGGMTVRWADEHIDEWLAKLQPEIALIMFGSNDVAQLSVAEYQAKMRGVVRRCLANGTIVILSTMPPRSGYVDKAKQFAEGVREIARELKVPLSDYFAEIIKRRPTDWDGSLTEFKGLPGDEYQVPTLIARDGVHPSNPRQYAGDYSEEALRSSGYALRNAITLATLAEVIEKVIQPAK